jgi:4-hydroxythreonine-4-phosphate dehydrogenase
MSREIPILSVSCGDPAGIGLEALMKALADGFLDADAALILHAVPELIEAQAGTLSRGEQFARLAAWTELAPETRPERPGLYRRTIAGDASACRPGIPSDEGARIMRAALIAAADDAIAGRSDGILTLPITKDIWEGESFAGQTEWLAHRAGVQSVSMMLAGPVLRVVPATTHMALREVSERLDPEGIVDQLQRMDSALRRDFAIASPRLAVCALNPHAGEGGRFGDEDQRIVEPAIAIARKQGIQIEGPIPADTLFAFALEGRWDAILAMYHDQGLIPFKMAHFDEGVNMTLGLPFVRTSPDHGVAHDIAGQDRARPESTGSALRMGLEIVRKRRRSDG